MADVLPIPANDRAFELRVELDGAFYGLRFWHNGRADRWFMSLLTDDGDLIASTLAISANAPINAHLRNLEGAPPGVLTCNDTQGRGDDPGADDLGSRHEIVYLTAEEVASLGAG